MDLIEYPTEVYQRSIPFCHWIIGWIQKVYFAYCEYSFANSNQSVVCILIPCRLTFTLGRRSISKRERRLVIVLKSPSCSHLQKSEEGSTHDLHPCMQWTYQTWLTEERRIIADVSNQWQMQRGLQQAYTPLPSLLADKKFLKYEEKQRGRKETDRKGGVTYKVKQVQSSTSQESLRLHWTIKLCNVTEIYQTGRGTPPIPLSSVTIHRFPQ